MRTYLGPILGYVLGVIAGWRALMNMGIQDPLDFCGGLIVVAFVAGPAVALLALVLYGMARSFVRPRRQGGRR